MVHEAVVMVTWSMLMLGIDWGDQVRSSRMLKMISFMRGQPQKSQGHGSPSALCAETPPWLVEAGVLCVHWGCPEVTLDKVVPFPRTGREHVHCIVEAVTLSFVVAKLPPGLSLRVNILELLFNMV